MLTTNGKNYIANKFGLNGCYVSSGMNWTYTSGSSIFNDTGGTGQLVSRLVMTSIVDYVTYLGVTYTYSDLKANNDNTNIGLEDVFWIVQNDGSPSTEPKFCVSGCNEINCGFIVS